MLGSIIRFLIFKKEAFGKLGLPVFISWAKIIISHIITFLSIEGALGKHLQMCDDVKNTAVCQKTLAVIGEDCSIMLFVLQSMRTGDAVMSLLCLSF